MNRDIGICDGKFSLRQNGIIYRGIILKRHEDEVQPGKGNSLPGVILQEPECKIQMQQLIGISQCALADLANPFQAVNHGASLYEEGGCCLHSVAAALQINPQSFQI